MTNNETKQKINFKKNLLILMLLILLIFTVIKLREFMIEPEGYIKPGYSEKDISEVLEKNQLSAEDYKLLFYQTGLGKPAIDDLMKNKEKGIKLILQFQDNFFKKKNVLCEKIGIITSQESFVNDNGKYIYGFDLAPYKNGYVLITKATHSLGWRHGHAAIVTGAEKGQTLEAVLLGTNSQFQNINKWRIYPSFMMLKLKNTSQKTLNEIASFARKNMYNIPYSLTVGLTSSKDPKNVTATQCSHLVWYPFKQFGYDVDSDDSWLVTPKDIANSDLFEIVQIYGVDPDEIWP